MIFTLRDDINRPVMSIGAENETEAWEKVKHCGFGCRSDIFKLVRMG